MSALPITGSGYYEHPIEIYSFKQLKTLLEDAETIRRYFTNNSGQYGFIKIKKNLIANELIDGTATPLFPIHINVPALNYNNVYINIIGDNHYITGMYYNDSTADNVALFDVSANTPTKKVNLTIFGLHLKDVDITANNSVAGFIAGIDAGVPAKSLCCYINNGGHAVIASSISGNIHGNMYVSSFMSVKEFITNKEYFSGSLIYCISTANIFAYSYAGGLAVYNNIYIYNGYENYKNFYLGTITCEIIKTTDATFLTNGAFDFNGSYNFYKYGNLINNINNQILYNDKQHISTDLNSLAPNNNYNIFAFNNIYTYSNLYLYNTSDIFYNFTNNSYKFIINYVLYKNKFLHLTLTETEQRAIGFYIKIKDKYYGYDYKSNIPIEIFTDIRVYTPEATEDNPNPTEITEYYVDENNLLNANGDYFYGDMYKKSSILALVEDATTIDIIVIQNSNNTIVPTLCTSYMTDTLNIDKTVHKNNYIYNTPINAKDINRSINITNYEKQLKTNTIPKFKQKLLTRSTEQKEKYKPNISYDKKLLISTIDKTEITRNMASVTYEVYNWNSINKGIEVHTTVMSIKRFLISINDGNTWLTYVNNNWIQCNITDINTKGITENILVNKVAMNALPTNFASKIKLAISLLSEGLQQDLSIKSCNINFAPNVGPTIDEFYITNHNTYINIYAYLKDIENDDISFRILNRTFNPDDVNGTEFVPFYPDNGQYITKKNGFEFNKDFNFDKLSTGENEFKLEVKDSKGILTEDIRQIYIYSGETNIEFLETKDHSCKFTINNTVNNDVRFKIYLNNQQVSPQGYIWTEWFKSPHTVQYQWNSAAVALNMSNTLTIEAEDKFGNANTNSYQFVGTYKGLLFKDINGNYYTTDTNDIIQILDFGSVIGGINSDPYIVYLENKTEANITNVRLYTYDPDVDDEVDIYISTTNEPFLPVTEINIGSMEENEVREFYVRIDSNINTKATARKNFKVYAYCDIINSDTESTT